ncbi:hypothetical protein SKAU_G00016520 [Synaphobranchus kaupii]|uniref:Uncharacterized protein n=1 Tax=Synaphobranchus kaupii TaxID=118154 RepID=A0A9Q1GCA3_SYNKA|nr:hypothetical protein SKAU_G00016520 [Synaphobranchus kaupii]
MATGPRSRDSSGMKGIQLNSEDRNSPLSCQHGGGALDPTRPERGVGLRCTLYPPIHLGKRATEQVSGVGPRLRWNVNSASFVAKAEPEIVCQAGATAALVQAKHLGMRRLCDAGPDRR